MINMKDLIKKQGNLIRKESGMNNKKKITEDVSTTQGIRDELERILVAWEDNVYPDDKTRWNDYYHDIEQLVTKIKK